MIDSYNIFPKFIIETDYEKGDCLIMSKCTYHKELVTNNKLVKGGGWFMLDNENKTCVFHGNSHDFGPSNFEDIKNCVENGNVYTNPSLEYSIVNKYKFGYHNDLEIIYFN